MQLCPLFDGVHDRVGQGLRVEKIEQQAVFAMALFFNPEVDIELGIIAHLDAVPVLRRAGGKLAGVNHHFDFRFACLFVSKAIIGDGSFHHAQLAENAGGGIVVAEQGGGDVLFDEKWRGAFNFPVSRNTQV